ncbi:DUF7133 domain-containing protein [Gayadomonas joobiniege]|uniref:DUF7133 domain-containing protein n=1 Tax=Gayadomonas joobiniege TaxID=1234606 RepID=UPI00037C73FB|nr:discoidin domain-containing protein [Gayadomonas joobiniege]
MKKIVFTISLVLAISAQIGCQNQQITDSGSAQTHTGGHSAAYHQKHERGPIKGLTPQDSLATMQLQDGYIMELVAHEPMVEEPVLATFDGNGRMYVAEMLTYMQDLDGKGQMQATSRIKRLIDSDNDGTMDKYTIFADGLLLPRMILPLEDGRILVRETNTFDILLLEDTDGDGVADKKSIAFKGGKRGGNLEHQPSGLIWGIDNWIYVTYTNRRYKIQGDKVIAENMRFGGGQWGLGQDAEGRLYYSAAGAEEPVFSFQFPTVYGGIPVKGETTDGFNEIFPIEHIPDVQGGLPRLRDDNTLDRFTGIAGQSIYLGDKLPELYGNYIAPEPVGHLIRRAEITRHDGYSVISHPYQSQKKEFIASTDSAFRPVWSETGPDGTLYLVDMYRGIIQEGNWTKPGSYLRQIIEKFGLDDITGRGRIYRVTKPGVERGEQPRLYQKSPAELVSYLSHPNQWWRLNAQKLMVLAGDHSIVPDLKTMARTHNEPLARLHALWTLEGLGIIDQSLLEQAFNDASSVVRVAAVRISEQLVNNNNQQMIDHWLKLLPKADVELAQQILLSAFYVAADENKRAQIRTKVLARYANKKGVKAIDTAMQYQIKEQQAKAKLAQGNKALAEALERGQQHFNSLCANCHGKDGLGTPAGNSLLAPSFKNNPRVQGNLALLGRIALDGLTGPIEGENYAGVIMASLASNDDLWLADVLTYIRNNFGNQASMVTAEQIAELRKNDQRRSPWTLPELEQKYGHKLTNKAQWQFSASHNPTGFKNLVDGKTGWGKWDSGELQKIGMWLQIKLPQKYYISQVEMDCRKWNWRCARSFDIEFSDDGKTWERVAQDISPSPRRVNQTLGKTAQYIRFVLTNGSPKQTWSITEIDLYGSPVQ